MRRFIALCAWLAVAACSSSSAAAPAPSPSPSRVVGGSPSSVAVKMAGGCGGTQVYKGGEPAWLTQAGANHNPSFIPYTITTPPNAAAYLFAYPLRAGSVSDPNNKILWVVGMPRNGSPLHVAGHPLNSAAPAVDYSFPDNASPGEIYPSIVDVPTAGCWHFDLSWGPNSTSVDLIYR